MIWKNLVFFFFLFYFNPRSNAKLSKVLYVSYIHHHHHHLSHPAPDPPSLNHFNLQERLNNPPRPEPAYQP